MPIQPATRIVILALITSLWMPVSYAALPENASSADVVLHITDFGIMQWHEDLKTGQHFGPTEAGNQGANFVHADLCARQAGCDAQILLVMPDDETLKRKSLDEIEMDFTQTVIEKLNTARAKGVREFEIQLIQNINRKGYTSKRRQGMVKDFGRIAHRAIRHAHNHLSNNGVDVYTDATVGSNGTVILTENVKSWSGYLQAIDLIDGRASMEATLKTIAAVRALTGKNRVRLFTTYNDWPAADRTLSKILGNYIDTATKLGSIGATLIKEHLGGTPKVAIANVNVVKDILQQHPDTQAYLLERLDREALGPVQKRIPLGVGHVSAMNGRTLGDSPFLASRLIVNNNSKIAATPSRVVFHRDFRSEDAFSNRPRTLGELQRLLQLTPNEDKWAVGFQELLRAKRGGVIDPEATPKHSQAIRWFYQQAHELIAVARPQERSMAVAAYLAQLDHSLHYSGSSADDKRAYERSRRAMVARFPDQGRQYIRWRAGSANTPFSVSKESTSSSIGSTLLVSRENAEILADSVSTLIGALEHLKSGRQLMAHPLTQELFDLDLKGALPKALERTYFFYDVQKALEKDRATFANTRFVLLRSHSFELAAKKVLAKALPDLYKHVLHPLHGRINAALRLPGPTYKLTGKSAPSLGAVEFVTAVSRNIGAGHANIETLTLYVDAFNNLVWGITGLVACGGNLSCAAFYQVAGDSLAKTFRRATLSWWERPNTKLRASGRELIDAWQRLQMTRMFMGESIVDFDQMHAKENLRRLGITKADIEHLNDIANIYRDGVEQERRLLNEGLAAYADPTKSLNYDEQMQKGVPKEVVIHTNTCSPSDGCLDDSIFRGYDDTGGPPGPGGVAINIDGRRIHNTGGDNAKQIIESKPTKDSLFW